MGFFLGPAWLTGLALQVVCWTGVAAERTPSGDALEHFEKRVRPVLVEHCYSCHSAQAERLKGGLRVDSRDGLLLGGDSGPALDLEIPARSRLLIAVGYENPDLQMPPKQRLSEVQRADLAAWVANGAPWPGGALAAPAAPALAKFDLEQRRREHWAWQAVRPVSLPTVRQPGWSDHPIDRFLLARLEARGLQPAGPADRPALLRRLSFDLTGLPPAAEELDAFDRDRSGAAWTREVDRLLASPRFGERWARHWLDLMRYAETLGHEFDYPIANAWRYRDYLIRAFNADVPYRQLAREHLAGDLLPDPRLHPEGGSNESIIGTAFYWLGQREHSPVDVRLHQAEVVDNQIDVLSKTFLGLTVACARCHDHKFDAISTRDYYALHGILGSSRYTQASLEPPAHLANPLGALRQLRQEIRPLVDGAESSIPRSSARPLPSQPSTESLTNSATALVDFARQGYEGWFVEGEAFGPGPARPGDFVVTHGDPPIRILTEGVAHSGLVSKRLQGTLRSPTFSLEHRFVHILAAGRSSRINLPVDNFTMIRDPIYGGLKRILDHDELRWITIDTDMWQGHRAYLEFADVRTPDSADDGRGQGFGPEGWIAVSKVIFSANSAPPSLAPGIPDPPSSVVLDRPLPDVAPGPSVQAASGQDSRAAEIDAWLARYGQVEAKLPDPRRVPSLADGTGLDERVFIRGQHRNPGEVVPRRFLEALGGAGQPVRTGSGRLELAEQIAAPDNPLFARVMVNRVWLHLFGRGLVATPDDLGVLGERPTHPELLDWLADWFRTEGQWSTKRLIRLLVTSRAYQMSSKPTDREAEDKDPDNRWWHRMPVRRLEGESIRDALLALSGRLDLTMFGPPVPVHLTEFMDGRGRPAASGPLDGHRRRSVYLEVRRNFLPPLMRAFDTPVPFTTIGRRTVSNVPAQALILMNDPFVQEEAGHWAKRLLGRPVATAEARLEGAFRDAFARPPSRQELDQSLAFLKSQAAAYDPLADEADLRVWADLCHTLVMAKEFILLN